LADHPGSFKTLASFYITLSSVSYTWRMYLLWMWYDTIVYFAQLNSLSWGGKWGRGGNWSHPSQLLSTSWL
jgi:hypothetical protein